MSVKRRAAPGRFKPFEPATPRKSHTIRNDLQCTPSRSTSPDENKADDIDFAVTPVKNKSKVNEDDVEIIEVSNNESSHIIDCVIIEEEEGLSLPITNDILLNNHTRNPILPELPSSIRDTETSTPENLHAKDEIKELCNSVIELYTDSHTKASTFLFSTFDHDKNNADLTLDYVREHVGNNLEDLNGEHINDNNDTIIFSTKTDIVAATNKDTLNVANKENVSELSTKPFRRESERSKKESKTHKNFMTRSKTTDKYFYDKILHNIKDAVVVLPRNVSSDGELLWSLGNEKRNVKDIKNQSENKLTVKLQNGEESQDSGKISSSKAGNVSEKSESSPPSKPLNNKVFPVTYTSSTLKEKQFEDNVAKKLAERAKQLGRPSALRSETHATGEVNLTPPVVTCDLYSEKPLALEVNLAPLIVTRKQKHLSPLNTPVEELPSIRTGKLIVKTKLHSPLKISTPAPTNSLVTPVTLANNIVLPTTSKNKNITPIVLDNAKCDNNPSPLVMTPNYDNISLHPSLRRMAETIQNENIEASTSATQLNATKCGCNITYCAHIKNVLSPNNRPNIDLCSPPSPQLQSSKNTPSKNKQFRPTLIPKSPTSKKALFGQTLLNEQVEYSTMKEESERLDAPSLKKEDSVEKAIIEICESISTASHYSSLNENDNEFRKVSVIQIPDTDSEDGQSMETNTEVDTKPIKIEPKVECKEESTEVAECERSSDNEPESDDEISSTPRRRRTIRQAKPKFPQSPVKPTLVKPTDAEKSEPANKLLPKSISVRQLRKLTQTLNLKQVRVNCVCLSHTVTDKTIKVCQSISSWNERNFLLHAGLSAYDIDRLGVERTCQKECNSKYDFRKIIKKSTLFQVLPPQKCNRPKSRQIRFLKQQQKRLREYEQEQRRKELQQRAELSIRRSLLKINSRYSNQSRFWVYLNTGSLKSPIEL